MEIAVSNIVWSKGLNQFFKFLNHLELRGIKGVELALNCFWDEPLAIKNHNYIKLKNEIERRGMRIVSLHSLTFNRPDLELFNTLNQRSKLIEYLKKFCDIANLLDCKNIVFGSPKARKTFNKNKDELDDIFLDFLQKIDSAITNVYFNIEPLSKKFCNYLNNFQEGIDLLKLGNFKNIFIQLDARTIIENNEDIFNIFENSSHIKHCHVSNPKLLIPGEPYSQIHSLINEGLNKIKYKGFVTAEITRQKKIKDCNYLDQTIRSINKLYKDC